jgi:hypothetical protein
VLASFSNPYDNVGRMESPLRPDILELIRICETLAGPDTVLTVRETEAVARCTRDLEKKVLPDRLQDDKPLADTLSNFPPID